MVEFSLKCIDACYFEEKIWMIDNCGYVLSSISLDDWTVQQNIVIDQMLPITYKKVLINEKSLFFIKDKGLEIFKYDLELYQSCIYTEKGNEENSVMHTFLYGKKIIILPLYIYDEIYTFDIQTCKFQTIKCFLNQYKNKEKTFVPSALIDKDKLWFVTEEGKVIKSYDLVNEKIEKYLLPKGISIGGISIFNNEFLLITTTGYEIYKWNPNDGITNYYSYKGLFDKNDRYARIIVCNEKVYAISMLSTGIYRIDESNNNVEKVYNMKIDEHAKMSALFMEILKIKNKIFILPWKAKYLVEIDCETDQIMEHRIFIKEETILNLIQILLGKQQLLYENRNLDGISLLNNVSKIDNIKVRNKKMNTKGKIIYEILK